MARGCCGGAARAYYSPNGGPGGSMPPSTQADPAGDNPSVKLRLTGDLSGARTYVGAVTGTRYRFGGDESHRERLVYQQDVQDLLDTGNFERVTDAPAQPVAPPPEAPAPPAPSGATP